MMSDGAPLMTSVTGVSTSPTTCASRSTVVVAEDSRTMASVLKKLTPSSTTLSPAATSGTRRQTPAAELPGQSVVCTSQVTCGALSTIWISQTCWTSAG